METRQELEMRRDMKFRKITDVVATDLGFGDFERSTSDIQTKAEQRAERRARLVIEHWQETVERAASPRKPNTPLETLLREYHEICSQISDLAA
jgi:hypothetical protein